MHTRDSHMFLFSESPTKTRRLPLSLSSMSVAFNLHKEREKKKNRAPKCINYSGMKESKSVNFKKRGFGCV